MPSSSKEKQREYDSKRAGRTRNWTTIAYPDDLPETWRDMIDETHVKWVESPLHDKDFNADGSPKKIHHHLLVIYDAVKSQAQVSQFFADIFGVSDTGSICGVATPQAVSDRSALVRYMAHMDNPSKAQYDPADIRGHGGADPMDLMKQSQSEMISDMIAIEEYIDGNNITEYSELLRRVRYDCPNWYVLIATKCTLHFRTYLASVRHSRGIEDNRDDA